MIPEEQRTSDFLLRMAFALEKDPTEDVRRTHVRLQVTVVTLIWLVAVPLLLGWGLTGEHRDPDVLATAAALTLVLPFVAAVIATRARRFALGGAYVILTLVMVIPAVAMVRAG